MSEIGNKNFLVTTSPFPGRGSSHYFLGIQFSDNTQFSGIQQNEQKNVQLPDYDTLHLFMYLFSFYLFTKTRFTEKGILIKVKY